MYGNNFAFHLRSTVSHHVTMLCIIFSLPNRKVCADGGKQIQVARARCRRIAMASSNMSAGRRLIETCIMPTVVKKAGWRDMRAKKCVACNRRAPASASISARLPLLQLKQHGGDVCEEVCSRWPPLSAGV